MATTGRISRAPGMRRIAGLAPTLAVVLLLGIAVWLRFVITNAAVLDPIAAGLLFGLALLGIAAVGWMRHAPGRGGGLADAGGLAGPAAFDLTRRAALRTVAIGLAGGAALIVLAVVGKAVADAPTLPPVIQASAFLPWSIATIVVATGEEAVLRGVLFDRLAGAGGLWVAIIATSVLFALMHVPFYGWRVVPLDFGVGIWLAGLRLASGGIVAPSIAHALADLATWWL